MPQPDYSLAPTVVSGVDNPCHYLLLSDGDPSGQYNLIMFDIYTSFGCLV